MYASLFDLYAVLDALIFQTVGADAHILPMGQKTTPSPDQVLVARKLNMGKSFRGELGGPDALSKRVGVYVVTLSLPPDMPVPAGYALQGRIENAFRRTALPLPSGGELRCEETTLQEPGTGQDGRYTLSVTIDLHTFYLMRRKRTNWNMPTQRMMDKGYFRVVERMTDAEDDYQFVTVTTMITGAGQYHLLAHFLDKYGVRRQLSLFGGETAWTRVRRHVRIAISLLGEHERPGSAWGPAFRCAGKSDSLSSLLNDLGKGFVQPCIDAFPRTRRE